MDDNQLEQVGMFVKVKTFLNKKTSELAATPAIAGTIQPALISKINDILEEDEDASSSISGNTELKRNLRSAVEDKGFEIAAACVAYYKITVPNPPLRAKCEFERSDLDRMRDAVLYVKIQKVHEIADPIKALLSDFGVVAADVNDLGTALTSYLAELEGPRDAIGERSASGKQVDRLIADAKEIITEQLDVVMKFYVTNNPELHDYYLTARAIDGTGGGEIPDEDETITIAKGDFAGGPIAPEATADSRIVISSGASNGADVNYGFSNMPGFFSGTSKTLNPGNTDDKKIVDFGFATGVTNFVMQNTGSPNAVSVTIRVKVFY